jgi:hypothetical protein
VRLNGGRVEGKHQKFNLFEVLKVLLLSQDIDNSLRQKQLDIYRKRIHEREAIEPDRRPRTVFLKDCESISLRFN